jgi:excisionase family DNA binding protein
MTAEPAEFLTVDEAARRLRVTPQTVYRWCRSDRIAATKAGYQWRIPSHLLGRREDPAGRVTLDALLRGICGHTEHLLGVAEDAVSLARLEAAFFSVGASAGGRLVHAGWSETAEAVRARLRPELAAAQRRKSPLRLLQLQGPYEKDGPEAPARLLMKEMERAAADGVPCYIYSSTCRYFGVYVSRLVAFEDCVGERIAGANTQMLCGCALSVLHSNYEGRVLPALTELMDCHSGVIWYDGQRSLLLRPAGAPR